MWISLCASPHTKKLMSATMFHQDLLCIARRSLSKWHYNWHRLASTNSNQRLGPLHQSLSGLPCHSYTCHSVLQKSSLSTASGDHLSACRLPHRSLIQATGADTLTLLQGLVTNDTELLEAENSCIASFILNVQGRVLYDMLLYRIAGDQRVLIECDSQIAPEFLSLIRKYKIRRKVNLSLVDDEMKVWAVIPNDSAGSMEITPHPDVVSCIPDPRVSSLGSRLILPDSVSAESVIGKHGDVCENDYVYRTRRYQLGIAEGIEELPPGNCFPLESNAVFTSAVSFNKGCFIGQELTARTHHLGVTRKRIMPLVFCSTSHTCSAGDTAVNDAGKNSGKVRGVHGQYGLALLRLPNVINTPMLTMKNASGTTTAEATTHMPDWWHIASNKLITELLEARDKKTESK